MDRSALRLMPGALVLVAMGFTPDARAQSCGSLGAAQACANNANSGTTGSLIENNYFAVYGYDQSAPGSVAVGAYSTSGIGVQGVVDSGVGWVGVFGVAANGGTLNASGEPPNSVLGIPSGTLYTVPPSTGVAGYSDSGPGVFGTTSYPSSAGSPYAGVSGVNSGSGYGVYAHSNAGDALHAWANGGNGVVGQSGSSVGVYGTSAGCLAAAPGPYGVFGCSGGGYGVYGTSSGGDGGHFLTSAAGYNAIYASNSDSTSSNSNGITGVAASGTAIGILGQNNAGGVGVRGESGSPGGYGVYGHGGTYGVYGIGPSSGYYGVYGQTHSGWAVFGEDSGNGYGVSGVSSGSGYGGFFDTTSGTYAAYFNKDIYVNGASLGPSDIRFKKNIKPVVGAIDQLLRLRGVTFDWKEPEMHDGLTGTQIGFIAQEVETVFPEWVRTDRDGFKAVTVAQIEGLEVESIRALKFENDALRARLDGIESGLNPDRAGFTFGNAGWGLAGLVLGAAVIASRRKRSEPAA